MKELSLSEKLTYSTVLIKSFYDNGTAATGTGFIFNLCQNGELAVPVIITNKHVVNECKEIEFEFCLKNGDGSANDLETVKIRYQNSNWYYHPNSDVDLCCLPIANVLSQLSNNKKEVFYIPLSKDIIPSKEEIEEYTALEEVSMIGYPIGLSDLYNHKPIIRRGVTATHIKKDYQGKKEFLVDMACFPGSSGSPIFLLNEGTYVQNKSIIMGSRIKFIGILYAGPQYNAQGELVVYSHPNIISKTNIPTNLGVAIKAERIQDFEEHFQKILNQQSK